MSEVEAQAVNEVEGAEAVEESQPSEAEAQVQSLLKTFKLKVDGEEIEEQIDLSDEEGLRSKLQLAKAAHRRMQEAARQKQEAEQFIQRLRSNPLEVLNDPTLGVNFREVAEQYLAEQLEQELMSPEEKKLREAERILRERDEEQKSRAEREEQEQLERLKDHYAADYDKKITEALSLGGLPKTPSTVKRMAQLMKMNLSNGLDLEPKEIVQLVREDYLKEMKELFGGADGETLMSLLGDEIVAKVRKTDLQKLKARLPSRKQAGYSSGGGERPNKNLSRDEWRAWLDSRVQD